MNKRCKGKRKRGFTLVELVIAIAVLSIFALGATGVMVPITNTYAQAVELSGSRMIAGNIIEMLRNELAFASDIQIIADDRIQFQGKDGPTEISLKQGYLYRATKTVDGAAGEAQQAVTKEVPLYDAGYYKGRTLGLSFSQGEADAPAQAIRITLEILREGVTVYTQASVIVPLQAL